MGVPAPARGGHAAAAGTAVAPTGGRDTAPRDSPGQTAREHHDHAAQRIATAFLLGYHGNTRAAYARDLAHYGAWCAATGVEVLVARRAHLDAYTEQLRRDDASPATIVRRLAALSGFYAYAVDEGLCAANPVTRVRRPRTGEHVQSTGLSLEEATRLLAGAEADSPRASVVVHLLLLCGLRVSELTGARLEDLGHQRGHRVLTVIRKGGRPQTMVLPPRAVDALETYVQDRVSGPLLLTARGRAMDRVAVWRLVRRLATRAVPHLADSLHPHDLRHACATLALDAGASLRDVQDLLGHADPRTTRRYDRARHNLDRSPSYALAGLLAGDTPRT